MIDSKKLMKYAGGIAAGEAVGYGADWAEQQNPSLKQFYFGEMIGLLGGPAVIGVGWKLSKGRHQEEADALALMGVTMFIDRLGKLAAGMAGIKGGVTTVQRSFAAAPPPGYGGQVQHSPISMQQRLPFQSDMTW